MQSIWSILVQCLHITTVILYFNRTQYMTDLVMMQPNAYSYKIQNDYATSSLKLVYQNQLVSITLYLVMVISYMLQLLTMLLMYLNTQLSRLATYMYYYLLCLIAIYSVGQCIQVFNYDFSNELTKLSAYQNKEDTQSAQDDMDEEGELAMTIWQFYFTGVVIIEVSLKILYLIMGITFYKRLYTQNQI